MKYFSMIVAVIFLVMALIFSMYERTSSEILFVGLALWMELIAISEKIIEKLETK